MKKTLAFLSSLMLMFTFSASAQLYLRDSLFGTNGFASFIIPAGPECTEITHYQNGYFLIGGYDYNIANNDYHIDIVKSDYCGDLDSTFGVNGLVRHTFSQRNTMFDMQVQDDYKILTCGIESTSNAGSGQIPYVARFNTDGSPDTTFGTLGSNTLRFDNISSGRFIGVRQMPDGRVVCTGYSTGNINGGSNGIGVMRFTANGVLDSSFSGDGIERYLLSIGNGLGAGFITSDDDVIAAGSWVDNAFIRHFLVAAWDSAGVLDSTFFTGGIYMDSVFAITADVYAVRDSIGFITLAATLDPGPNTILLLRLSPDGYPDPTFGVDGFALAIDASIGSATGLQLMPNGKYLLLGTSLSGGGFSMMLEHNGNPEISFGYLGYLDTPVIIGSGNYARGMIELPNGQWVIAGSGGALNAARFALVSDVPHIEQVNNYLQTTGSGLYQWYLNGSPMPGATNNTLLITQNGSYTVLLTGDYGCSYMSDPYVVTNSAIEENISQSITIYPSIITDRFFISNTTGQMIAISMYNVNGKKVMSFEVSNEFLEKNISGLAPGMYFLQSGNDGAMMKLVKK